MMRAFRPILVATLVVAGAVAWPAGVALANSPQVRASCETGLRFEMPQGEAGTKVTVFLDNVRVHGPIEVARHGDPVTFTVPAPADRSIPHSWVVEVDSVWNQDQRIVRTVPACTSAVSTSTSTSAPSTTTTSAPSTTTSAPSPSTTVASTSTTPATTGSTFTTSTSTPPVPTGPTTVVPGTTPRTVNSTTPPGSTPPATPILPATGPEVIGWALAAAAALFAGVVARRASRRPS